MKRKIYFLATFCSLFLLLNGKKFEEDKKPEWAKKDIRDYSDVDLERLLDQWEEDEEPLPEDELPEYLRKPPPMDMSSLDINDPESFLQASKKGKTLMAFVSVANNPSRSRTETVTKLWQTSLWNNHIQAERYLIDDDRAIFMFKDGSQAWTAKDFLIEQEECKEVSIENKVYPGKYPDKKNPAIEDSKDEL